MKILLVSHTFLPNYVGGTEVYTAELAQQLVINGHEVEILCTDPLSKKKPYSLTKRKFKNLTVNVIEKDILQYSGFEQTYLDNQVDKIFEKFIDRFKPEVIHYTHLMHLSLNLVSIAAKKNIKQVATLNDFWFQTHLFNRVTSRGDIYETFSREKDAQELSDQLNAGPKVSTPFGLDYFLKSDNKTSYLKTIFKKIAQRLLGKLLVPIQLNKYLEMIDHRSQVMRAVLASLDLVIFPTVFLYQEFSRWGFQSKQVIISNHGIDTSLFKNFKKKKKPQLKFAFIGAIIPAKGLDMLLKAWKTIDHKDAELDIYGNFELDKKYSRSLQNLLSGLNNVNLKGTFKPEEIARVFSEIDVLVLPSRWFENGPLVLRNSLLANVPVIATNLGSNPEFIKHGSSGLLFLNEDVSDLADKIQSLIDEPNLIMEMSKNTKKQKSIATDAKNLIKNYQDLLAL